MRASIVMAHKTGQDDEADPTRQRTVIVCLGAVDSLQQLLSLGHRRQA
jgi:hypothetical protein